MLQAIGGDICADFSKFHEQIHVQHDHLDLYIKQDFDGLFRLEIRTKNDTILMAVTFEDTEVALDLGYRLRSDVMRLPKDRSMLEAIGLYLLMMEPANQYLHDHFIGGSDSVVDEEVLRRFEKAKH